MDACRDAGLDAALAAWDDPAVDWASFDLAVVRSTWNFYECEHAFRHWIERTDEATRLLNPASLMLRTIDKTYLAELERSGVPVVPTHFLAPSENIEEVVTERGWDRFVLKPTVSAGSYMTERFSLDSLAQAGEFAASLSRTHKVMVQPYMSAVERGGEVALNHVDGELTHGVLKSPRFVGQEESVSSAITPSSEQRAVAEKVMETIGEAWLYARIDLMADEDGEWLLSEMEVIEPSLFFLQHRPAMERFIAALQRLLS